MSQKLSLSSRGLSVLKHPALQWAVALYLGFVFVAFGIQWIRFAPELAQATRSGSASVTGRIEGYTSRLFFGGSEYRFKLEGAPRVYTIFPGTLNPGMRMLEAGAETTIQYTHQGGWVMEMTQTNAPGTPQIVNKAAASRALEDAEQGAYSRGLLSVGAGLLVIAIPFILGRLRRGRRR